MITNRLTVYDMGISALDSICKSTCHRVDSKSCLYSSKVMSQSLLARIIANERNKI